MSNIQQTDWISIRPAIAIVPIRGYIQLPVFDLELSIPPNASIIVAQYNYSATKPFVLHRRPAVPVDCNYCLCIRYRVGHTVYRYKLWEGIGEVLNVPLYTGQVILQNFCLEVWNLANVDAADNSNETVAQRTIYLSIQQIPTNYRDLSAYLEANASDPAILANVNTPIVATPPTVGMEAWYKSDTGTHVTLGVITKWDDQSVNGNNLTLTTGGTSLQANQINGFPAVRFPGSGGVSLTSDNGLLSQLIALVFTQKGWLNNHKLFTKATLLKQHAGANAINWNNATDIGTNMDLGSYYILFIANGTMSIMTVDAKTPVDSCPATMSVLDTSQLVLGDAVNDAQFDLAEFLVYDANGNNADTINKLTTYFAYRYANQSVFSLPLEFDASSPWLDNTPVVPQLPI